MNNTPNDDPNKPDNDTQGGEPMKPEGADGWPNLMAEFCETQYPARARGFLTPYAAHVVFMTRMTGSSRLTATFFAQKLGRSISRRPVEDIINKVRRGEVVITSDQLAAIAREHPTAQRYAEHHPEILDPKLAVVNPIKKVIREKVETRKVGRKSTAKKMVKKAAKKSGKVAKLAKKKTARKTPRSGPDPGPELPGLGK